MQRTKTVSPLVQLVKGIFIFNTRQGIGSELALLMPSIDCEILTNHGDRMMVKTTLENLQMLKKCWQTNDGKSELSRVLNKHITQILIGGRA